MFSETTPVDLSQYRRPDRGETIGGISLREYEEKDCASVVDLMVRNFNGDPYSLIPRDGKNGYIAANRVGDVRHAILTSGSQAYVSEFEGKISGFILLRHTGSPRRDDRGRHYTGVVAIKRLHVDPTVQGQGTGKAFFDLAEKKAKELQAESIVSDASGSSRMYFERSGFSGVTVLKEMDKRGTSVVVFAATKSLVPPEYPLYLQPTHVIYAGSNKFKQEFIRKLTPQHIPVIPHETEEDELTHDVVQAAFSKTSSTARRFRYTQPMNPLIVANDVRTDILEATSIGGHRKNYRLVNRGKPSADQMGEILNNFQILRNTARITKSPAPYVVRSATYLHSPQEPGRDTFSESDVSVWLTHDALEYLATPEGLQSYRDQVYDEWHVDISSMSGGFALPIFLKRGYVAGLNGHPIETIPHKDEVVEKAMYTVMGGISEHVLGERFGKFG